MNGYANLNAVCPYLREYISDFGATLALSTNIAGHENPDLSSFNVIPTLFLGPLALSAWLDFI